MTQARITMAEYTYIGDKQTMAADQPEIKECACPVCHSDMHAKSPSNSGYVCVWCGYEDDENGNALI